MLAAALRSGLRRRPLQTGTLLKRNSIKNTSTSQSFSSTTTLFKQFPFIQETAVVVGGVVQLLAITYCIQNYLVDITMCVGPSMLPTLNSAGDIVLINRFLHRYRAVEYNDIVVAKSPSNPQQIVCKRVLGTSGDHVKYDRPRCGNMEFSYSKNGIVVPEGHVWLQGDNESNSTDSRHYGPVPEALVSGIVIARIWPPKDVGQIKNKIEKTTRKSVVRTNAKQHVYNLKMKQESKRQKKLEKKEKERKRIAEAKQVVVEQQQKQVLKSKKKRRRSGNDEDDEDDDNNDDEDIDVSAAGTGAAKDTEDSIEV